MSLYLIVHDSDVAVLFYFSVDHLNAELWLCDVEYGTLFFVVSWLCVIGLVVYRMVALVSAMHRVVSGFACDVVVIASSVAGF